METPDYLTCECTHCEGRRDKLAEVTEEPTCDEVDLIAAGLAWSDLRPILYHSLSEDIEFVQTSRKLVGWGRGQTLDSYYLDSSWKEVESYHWDELK